MAALTVVYGRDADAATVARAADRALEGHHVRAMVSETEHGEAAVWLVERNDPVALGCWLLPGQRLVVESSGTWRIEGEPPVKRTPEAWSAEYGIEIYDRDGWRGEDAPAWDESITLAEFRDRAAESTISGILSVKVWAAWDRLSRDVKAGQA